jgi:hypothetical protein
MNRPQSIDGLNSNGYHQRTPASAEQVETVVSRIQLLVAGLYFEKAPSSK